MRKQFAQFARLADDSTVRKNSLYRFANSANSNSALLIAGIVEIVGIVIKLFGYN